jgi:2-desacetyl-2-hydroxyethyl bacteriochlorophyllide A dehydrogenase
MQAVLFPQPHEATLADVPAPEPGPGEVLVAVKAAGVCGTDVHLYDGDFIGTYPLIPGHEFAGEVVSVGPEVDEVAVGDRVAVQPCRYCGRCEACRAQRQHFCRSLQAYGVHLPGGFAELCVVHQENLYQLGGLSYVEGSLLEPLACCIHGINQLGVVPGDNVLIFGSGPIGLLLAQLARNGGGARTTVVDPVEEKLATAVQLGIDDAFTPADFAARRGRDAPDVYDLVIDATGVPEVVAGLFDYVRDAGRLLFFGVCPQEARISVSPYDVYKRELKISGTFSLLGEMEAALRLARAGRVRLTPLVSQRLPLSGFPDALSEKARGGAGLKTVLEPEL